MTIVKFFSFIKHERDKVGDFGFRAVLHFPIGYVIGLLFPFSYPALLLFIRYEENEDVHTKDQAWKDYSGALVGSVFGCLTTVSLLVYLIIRLLGGVL